MNKSKLIWTILIIAIIVIGITLIVNSITTPGKYDEFAQCLTDKGIKMYGAYWCPHCTAQKELFGKSWKYVNYIECSLPNRAGQTTECRDAGIQSYPTWEFVDSSRISGSLSLQQLNEKSDCELGE